MKKKVYFCKRFGEMLEWLKRHAWKVCKRQKRFQGSNPCLSAKQTLQDAEIRLLQGFLFAANLRSGSIYCLKICFAEHKYYSSKKFL